MNLDQTTNHAFTNHLANESSPYLLSHAHNPVDWYPWGAEALEKAKRENKPIFLSIGYASCHWCHVMERESFENETIAQFLNDHFVAIKVDREQRPDLDQIYMSFTTALTGSGGWPMSVFLTSDLKPFFAGTYFPPEDGYGRPGFKRVITEIARAYEEDKETILSSSEDIFTSVTDRIKSAAPPVLITKNLIKQSAMALMNGYDSAYGGFGQAPKFPHPMELSLFMRYYKSSGDLSYMAAVEQTLTMMARGGIYDQLGGGFARYSTDRQWQVPHFEKMLYDNALLVPVYVDAFRITENEYYREIVRGTLDFILNDMTDSTGGFYSALDADSEGEEGKFYVWKKSEIEELLGDRAGLLSEYYGMTQAGNFEGKNILHLNGSSERIKLDFGPEAFNRFLSEARATLIERRAQRVRPTTDDKILTSWNGLALSAFCRGYQITGEKKYLDAALANAAFITNDLYRDGRLTHSYRHGVHSEGEFLEDYAFLTAGLLDLYETDPGDDHIKWLQIAVALADRATELFMDDNGRFYLRPDGQADLIVRPADETDSAIPAPGSVMLGSLLKLNRLTGNEKYWQTGENGLKALSGQIANYPGGKTSALAAVDYYLNDKIEIVVVGRGAAHDDFIKTIYLKYIPNRLLAFSADGRDPLPLFEGRASTNGKVSAYLCRNSACNLPATSTDELTLQLNGI